MRARNRCERRAGWWRWRRCWIRLTALLVAEFARIRGGANPNSGEFGYKQRCRIRSVPPLVEGGANNLVYPADLAAARPTDLARRERRATLTTTQVPEFKGMPDHFLGR